MLFIIIFICVASINLYSPRLFIFIVVFGFFLLIFVIAVDFFLLVFSFFILFDLLLIEKKMSLRKFKKNSEI